MNAHIPRYINPVQMTKLGACISGILLIKDCPRLTKMLFDEVGEIHVELKFGIDVLHYKYIHGQVDANLHLPCQRCLKPMLVNVNSVFDLGLIYDDQRVQSLPKNYEPLLISEKEINLNELIEEEVLLSLPLVTMHPENQCAVSLADINKNLI